MNLDELITIISKCALINKKDLNSNGQGTVNTVVRDAKIWTKPVIIFKCPLSLTSEATSKLAASALRSSILSNSSALGSGAGTLSLPAASASCSA